MQIADYARFLTATTTAYVRPVDTTHETRRTRPDICPPPSAPWLCAKAVYLRAERPIFEPATFSVASPTL